MVRFSQRETNSKSEQQRHRCHLHQSTNTRTYNSKPAAAAAASCLFVIKLACNRQTVRFGVPFMNAFFLFLSKENRFHLA